MSSYSALERLLGLPEGSTEGDSVEKVAPVITKGIANKTTQLQNNVTEVEMIENMSSNDIVKYGISLDMLEQDKERIRREAFEVYDIAKSILTRFKEEMDTAIEFNDRMFTAGGKIVDSVSGSLDKLTNMILKFKQDEETKMMLTNDANTDDGKKEMTPRDWVAFVREVKADKDNEKIETIEILK